MTTESLRAALAELVACEDMRYEMLRLRSDPYYITQADAMECRYDRRVDSAWDNARAVLAAAPEPPRLRSLHEMGYVAPTPKPAFTVQATYKHTGPLKPRTFTEPEETARWHAAADAAADAADWTLQTR